MKVKHYIILHFRVSHDKKIYYLCRKLRYTNFTQHLCKLRYTNFSLAIGYKQLIYHRKIEYYVFKGKLKFLIWNAPKNSFITIQLAEIMQMICRSECWDWTKKFYTNHGSILPLD